MILRTDTIEREDIVRAAREAHVDFDRLEEKRSRSRRGIAWDVLLTGSSPRRPNRRGAGGDYAATWDEWGIFLAALYREDPTMMAGDYYWDADHFHLVTCDRFLGGFNHADQHRTGHRWEPLGMIRSNPRTVGFECACGAQQEQLRDVKRSEWKTVKRELVR